MNVKELFKKYDLDLPLTDLERAVIEQHCKVCYGLLEEGKCSRCNKLLEYYRQVQS